VMNMRASTRRDQSTEFLRKTSSMSALGRWCMGPMRSSIPIRDLWPLA
jgi:hypothetical protein